LTLDLHALAAPESGRHPLLLDGLTRASFVKLVEKVIKSCALLALLIFGFSETSSPVLVFRYDFGITEIKFNPSPLGKIF